MIKSIIPDIETISNLIYDVLAGNKRTAEKASKFVIHPITYNANGSLSYFQVEEIHQMLEADIKNYAMIVNKETHCLNKMHSVEEYLKGKSLTLLPEEALKCGIITDI